MTAPTIPVMLGNRSIRSRDKAVIFVGGNFFFLWEEGGPRTSLSFSGADPGRFGNFFYQIFVVFLGF